MGWSLLAFQNSAARNGLTAIPPVSDETQYTVSATNYAKLSRDGVVSAVAFRTAAIANFVSARFRESGMRNYIEAYHAIDQTRQLLGAQDFLPANIPIAKGNLIEAQADNGNNAQVEAAFVVFGDPTKFSNTPPHGAYPIKATCSTANVANVWKNKGDVTWSETFNTKKRYKIVGMMGHSATGYAARLISSDYKERPGCLLADNAQLQVPLYGDFGWFDGDNPPSIESIASGTDTTLNVTLFVV